LSEYKNIIFVAHSMGGLVAKSCILKMIKYGRNDNIKGFISLAVPHAGSELASYSSMISSSAQIKDLKVFSDETDSLNREWLASNQTPSSKFIYGTNDLIVNKKSALPIQILAKDSVAVHEDHGTICKPSDTDNNVYKLVKRFILEIDRDNREPLVINDFVDENQYDNEYFVLKMIVADVHDDISNHAKEYYYNAELARNFFTSDRDRAILDGLYRKIKGLYQTQFQSAIANHLTSDQLLSAIHKKIEDEDRAALNVLLSDFDNLHKKGMLHQLANKSNRDVIWSADTTLESLNQLRSSQ
ncbi:ABC-three component system protein, partial [Escherichia coli]|uniref:ABC-three component system protein n=1 Tax=Escherichia coli TaxID=562 RepID=UPI0029C5386B